MNGEREIFVGDVHGCFDEFMELLQAVDYLPERDRLYLTGDTVNRGPKSREMLDWLIARPEVRSVRGNHEFCLARALDPADGELRPWLRRVAGLLMPGRDKYFPYLSSLPPFLETERWILVHAGLLPGQAPALTDPGHLATVREVETGPDGEKLPWFRLYDGKKMVIFGHWARRGLVRDGLVRGLDSGCVYGHELSALLLPEDRFVSVKARRAYYDPELKCDLW